MPFDFNDWNSIKESLEKTPIEERSGFYSDLVKESYAHYSDLDEGKLEEKLDELGEFLNGAPAGNDMPQQVPPDKKKRKRKRPPVERPSSKPENKKKKPIPKKKVLKPKYHTRNRTMTALFMHGATNDNAIDLNSSDEETTEEELGSGDDYEEVDSNDPLSKYKFKTTPKPVGDKTTGKPKYVCQIPGCKCPASTKHNTELHIKAHLNYIRERLAGKRPHGNSLHKTIPKVVADDLKKQVTKRRRRKDIIRDDSEGPAPASPTSTIYDKKMADVMTKILAQIMRGAEAQSRESAPPQPFFGIGEGSSRVDPLPEDEYVRPHHNMAAYAKAVQEAIDRIANGDDLFEEPEKPEEWMDGDHFSRDGQEFIRRMAKKPHYESDSLAKSDVFTLRKYMQFLVYMEEDPQIPMSNGQLKRFFAFLAYYSHLALPTMETVVFHGLLRLGFAGDYSSESTFRSVCHGIWNDMRHDDNVKQSGPGNHPLTPVTWRCVLDRVKNTFPKYYQTVSFISFCISTACRGDSTRRVRFSDLLGYEKRRDGHVLLRVNIPRSKTHYRDNTIRTIGGWENSPDPSDPIRAITEYLRAQYNLELKEVVESHIKAGKKKSTWTLEDGRVIDGNALVWDVNLNSMTDRLKKLLYSAGFRELKGWGVHSCRSGWLTGLFEMNDKPGKMRAVMEHGAVLAGWKANSDVEFGYVKSALKSKTDMAAQIDMGTVPPSGVSLDETKDEVHTSLDYDSKFEVAKRLRMTESLHQVKLAEPENPRVEVPEDYKEVQIRKPGQVEQMLCGLQEGWLRPRLVAYFNCHKDLVETLDVDPNYQEMKKEEKEEMKVALAVRMLESLYKEKSTKIVEEIVETGNRVNKEIEEEEEGEEVQEEEEDLY